MAIHSAIVLEISVADRLCEYFFDFKKSSILSIEADYWSFT